MTSNDVSNWPDGDVILRATNGTDTRDFRVHKLILTLASPVFKDMFTIPRPPSSSSNNDNVEIVDVIDPPRALDLILRFIYPSSPPVIEDLTVLSECLVLADKYDIEAGLSRLRPSLKDFAKAEPLRVYAIACRLGFEKEMEVALSHSKSIDLLGLAELPDEFRFIPATAYHRFVRLHRALPLKKFERRPNEDQVGGNLGGEEEEDMGFGLFGDQANANLNTEDDLFGLYEDQVHGNLGGEVEEDMGFGLFD